MRTKEKISLVVTIHDHNSQNKIGHHLEIIRYQNSEEAVHIAKVVYSDWIPSGSFGTVELFTGDELLFSQQKRIPNWPVANEIAEVGKSYLGEQFVKHPFDVWVRASVDKAGCGNLEVHMGPGGAHPFKAVFQTSFKA